MDAYCSTSFFNPLKHTAAPSLALHPARLPTSICTSFASQAGVQFVASSPRDDVYFSRFKAAFDPKYDLQERPSHTKFLQPSNLFFILCRRLVIDVYLVFVTRHVDEIERKSKISEDRMMSDDYDDEIEDMDDEEAVQWDMNTVTPIFVDAAHAAGWQAVAEMWIGVIRIAYSKYVWDHCNCRLRWKMLKGAYSSALRKLSSFGVLGLRKCWWTVCRSASLQSAAEFTYSMCLLPRRYNLSRGPKYICRAIVVEFGLCCIRLVASTIGATCGLSLAFFVAWSCGHKVGPGTWDIQKGGREQRVHICFVWMAAFGSNASDTLVTRAISPIARAWVEDAGDWATSDSCAVDLDSSVLDRSLHGLD